MRSLKSFQQISARGRNRSVSNIKKIYQACETCQLGREWREKPGKLLRVKLRHLGPIRMHILSGVKPAEIFMMCPTAAARGEEKGGEEKGGGGGGGDEAAGPASWGRHAHMEWLKEDITAVHAERVERGEETAGMMDRRTDREGEQGWGADALILADLLYRAARAASAPPSTHRRSARCNGSTDTVIMSEAGFVQGDTTGDASVSAPISDPS